MLKSNRPPCAGDLISDGARVDLIDGHPRSATVTATTPLKAFVVPHPGFQQLLDHDPEFVRQLIVSLCALLRAAEARHDSTPV